MENNEFLFTSTDESLKPIDKIYKYLLSKNYNVELKESRYCKYIVIDFKKLELVNDRNKYIYIKQSIVDYGLVN